MKPHPSPGLACGACYSPGPGSSGGRCPWLLSPLTSAPPPPLYRRSQETQDRTARRPLSLSLPGLARLEEEAFTTFLWQINISWALSSPQESGLRSYSASGILARALSLTLCHRHVTVAATKRVPLFSSNRTAKLLFSGRRLLWLPPPTARSAHLGAAPSHPGHIALLPPLPNRAAPA